MCFFPKECCRYKKKNETDVFGIVFRSFVANGRKWEELILWNYFFCLGRTTCWRQKSVRLDGGLSRSLPSLAPIKYSMRPSAAALAALAALAIRSIGGSKIGNGHNQGNINRLDFKTRPCEYRPQDLSIKF